MVAVMLSMFLASDMTQAASGLAAYWPFDTTSGNGYADVSGNGFNISPDLVLTKGIRGNALDCPGAEFDLSVANSQTGFILNRVTIEAWCCVRSFPASGAQSKILCFSLASPGIRNGFNWYVLERGNVGCAISSFDKGAWITVQSTHTIALNQWQHLACSYDGSVLRVYINGVLEGSTSYSGGIGYPVGIDARIGCERIGDGSVRNRINGRIDELKLYSLALPADSIAAHFNAFRQVPVLIPVTPNPAINPKPVLRWHKNDSIEVYTLQISTASSFASPMYTIPISDTFYQPTVNLPYGTVYWRVGDNADTALWSTVSSFIVQDPFVPVLVPVTPAPSRNRRPTLLWNDVDDTCTYTIQVNTDASFASPLIQNMVTDSFYIPSADLPVGAIYWRVKSSLRDQYSIPDTFVIASDSVPMLIPMNPDTQYNRQPTFKWNSAKGASSYQIQIDTLGVFTSPLITLPVSDTMFTPSADLPYGKIFWRVSAGSAAGQYSQVNMFWVIRPAAAGRGMAGTAPKPMSVRLAKRGSGIEITLHVEKPGAVSVGIYSLSGQCLATPYRGFVSAGKFQAVWSGKDVQGRVAPNGSYVVVARVNDRAAAEKISLIR